MPKSKTPRSPFQPISLSRADKKELQGVANTILEANYKRYLTFSGIDPKEWKLFEVKDKLRIYSGQPERKRRRYHFHSGRVDNNSELQSMLLIGSTIGKLDNMMHSVVDSSIANKTNRSSYVSDYTDVAVLSPIKEPTPADPLTSVAVKWMEVDVRRRSMGLIKNRDYVYVETSGVKFLSSGEQLGYHVMHSVGIPQAGGLPGRVRANLSVCTFFRQVSETSMSVYLMAILDPMSDRVRRVVVPRFMKTLLSVFESPQTDKMKQLAMSLTKGYSQLSSVRLSLPDSTCTTCTKRMWGFGSHYSACAVCCGYVCSSCKIEKKLKPQSRSQKKNKSKLAFCFSCLTDVMITDESEFSFEEQSTDNPAITRRVCHSVWSSRLPSWSVTRNKEASVNFTSTR